MRRDLDAGLNIRKVYVLVGSPLITVSKRSVSTSLMMKSFAEVVYSSSSRHAVKTKAKKNKMKGVERMEEISMQCKKEEKV